MAMKNQSRQSCTKAKIEVDFLGEFPQKIQVGYRKAIINEVKAKWINIKYDYIPKYFKICML